MDRAAILIHLKYVSYGLAVFFVGNEVESDPDPLTTSTLFSVSISPTTSAERLSLSKET